jgi:hypothetical protein
MQRALVPEDLLTDTERALDGFARIARAKARNDQDAPRIAVLLVFDSARRPHRRRATHAARGKRNGRESDRPPATPQRGSPHITTLIHPPPQISPGSAVRAAMRRRMMTKARAGVANPLHRSHRNDACPRRLPPAVGVSLPWTNQSSRLLSAAYGARR